jgi:polygalacturonase
MISRTVALILGLASVLMADDLPLASQTYGELRENLTVNGTPLQIAGKVHASGLGTHAVSEIPLSVPEGAVRFSGAVGLDDAQGPDKGDVIFRIFSGNAQLWCSPAKRSGDRATRFDVYVPFSRHRKLYLQADDHGNSDYDHANWVDLQWTKGEQITPPPPQIFSGRDLGLVSDTNADQSRAIMSAIQVLREHPGSTLKLEKGTYHFSSDGRMLRHFHISNHDQPVWQRVVIPLVDLRDITIDGQGSTFIFRDEVQPILIMDSENITLKGIAIDYAIPHHSQGKVLSVSSKAYEVEVDSQEFPHSIVNGWFSFWDGNKYCPDTGNGILFSGKSGAILAGTSDFNYKGKLTELGNGRYRIEKDLASAGVKPGDFIVFRQGAQRPHPAVTIYRSKDTTLTDCAIHSSHGMGILAQRSENIHLSGGGVFPQKDSGRVFSTGADATHFSNCKGLILAENGLYEGMMDDAINVHATCLRIEEKLDAKTIRCRYVHPQAVGFETFLPGETLRFIQAKWLTPRSPCKVVSVRKTSTTELILGLDQPVPDDLGKGDAVENADWFPEVIFRGNTVRHNRARGSLFTTPKKVLVENNRFESIAGSAILLAGDANGWYESGGCQDVLIRNNTFIDNLTSRFQFTEALISIYPTVPDLAGQTDHYHRNVRIEDNTFQTFDVPLVFAISTDGLAFRRNKVTYNQNFPGWNKPPFILRRCQNFTQEGNTVIRKGKPLTWTDKDVQSK